MPDNPDAAIAGIAARMPGVVATWRLGRAVRPQASGGAHRFLDGDVDGMELVIARHLLRENAAAEVLEDDEVPHKLQQPVFGEDTFEHDLKLGQPGRSVTASRDRAPGLEPLTAGAERADPSLDAVGGHQRGVGGEECWNLSLVGLKLLERGPDRGVFIGGVLQLDDAEWQTVDEQHNVGPPRVLGFRDRELVDGEPVVVSGRIEVDYLRLRARDGAVRPTIFHRNAVHEHAMHGAVALDERRRVDQRELSECIVDRFRRQAGVQPDQRLAQAAPKNDVAICRVSALGGRLALRDLRAALDLPAQAAEPGEGGVLDDGFGESSAHSDDRRCDPVGVLHSQLAGDKLGQ